MKRRSKLVAGLLACSVFLSGCGFLPDLAQQFQNYIQPNAVLAEVPYIDPSIPTSFSVCQSTFYFDQLRSESARTIYRAALHQFATNETEPVYLKGAYSPQEVAAALRAVQYDYPALLCAPWGQKCSYYTTASGEALGIELYYSSTPAERAAFRQALSAAAGAILEQAAQYDDLYERELFLYESVVVSAVYDYDAAAASLTVVGDAVANLTLPERMAHTAYGALVSNLAVCDGYAGAFQLLCNYAGIDCATMIGSADWNSTNRTDSTGRDNHAWNLVNLPSGSYYCDATWDDNGDAWLDANGHMINAPVSSGGMRRLDMPTLHRYMNLSYEEISQNHEFADGYEYPQAFAQADNYFVREGLVAASPAALSAYAEQLASRQDWPSMLSFEVRLGFEPGDAKEVLSGSFAGIGGYNYMFSSTPANLTRCYFVCLYY